jgi:Kef-type K+ transport system membrane component KefB
MTAILILLALAGLMQAAGTFAPPSTQLAGPELTFGFLLLCAFFTARLVSNLGLPRLTGYLLAGIITGPFVFGLVTRPLTDELQMVKGVAVCLIALNAGSELNLARIRPLMRTIRAMTAWAVVGNMLLIGGVLYAIRPLVPFLDAMSSTEAIAVAATLGVALSAQSPAVVMALVNETRSQGRVTDVILAMVVLADLVVIICYAISSAIATAVIGGSLDVASTIGGVSWELFGSAALGLFIGLLLGTFVSKVAGGHSLFATMVCFVVAEVGKAIHLDPLIVMLTAGIYLENVSRADATRLIRDLESSQLPVYLVFFALAGAELHLGELYHLALPVAIIVLVRAFGFWVGAGIATAHTSAPPEVRRYAWYGLLPQAGLALALALLIGRTFPSFGAAAQALVIGTIGVNELVGPVILRVMLVRSGEAGKRAAVDFEVASH